MSLRALVIPEDPTYNGYILKPLVVRMLEELGKPKASVTVLTNPRAEGYHHAKSLLPSVLDRNRHMDLFLFLPDADGKDHSGEFDALEQQARKKDRSLFCCAAVQMVEAWLLAGHADKLTSPWSQVRADTAVKANHFESFLKKYGDEKRAGGGRDLLIKETLGNYAGLLARSPELKDLQDRLQAWLGAP